MSARYLCTVANLRAMHGRKQGKEAGERTVGPPQFVLLLPEGKRGREKVQMEDEENLSRVRAIQLCIQMLLSSNENARARRAEFS